MRSGPTFLMILTGIASATATSGMNYPIPADDAVELLPGRDRDLTAGTCAACHSLDYITTQPRGKGAQFWKDGVAKMVKVYGAPIEPADADRIADYLGATYGAPPP
ncbi:cytochrome C [Sphingobium amiense]|uniref:Cytochrome C n=1 Tax=Sphingobium amiense TaxID=135719 RepID=A0A494W5W3_9SPHN|nr:cytochrome C [Sphingobium amiense]BBD99963.1 cytochrome C [Sphingobium amiense]